MGLHSDHLWMMGHDRTVSGDVIPGARIMKVYDLIEEGIAWQPNILTSPLFTEVVKTVKENFRIL